MLVSVSWPEVMAQRTFFQRGSRLNILTGNETNTYIVSFIYSFNDKNYDGTFMTKSKLFDSDIKYFAVRVNPEKPEEALFNEPSWIVIIIFFIVAISLYGIGFVNILEKNKEYKNFPS